MRIGFLTTANSWHIPVKTKYFVEAGHEVFYLQVFPGTGQKIVPEGVKCFDIKSSLPPFFGFFHKILIARKVSKNLNLDVVHIIGMGKSYFAYFVKTKKIVIENNGSDVLVLPQKYKLLKYIYKILYKKADAVVQDSNIAKEAGLSCGAPLKHNEIIELGIDFKIFNPNIEKNIMKRRYGLKDEKLIFSPRGFTELYNIETIIRSIPLVKKEYPDIKFVFCRHFGKDESFYDEIIQRLEVHENVIFTGFLDNEKELPYFYKDADIVVSVPSSDSSPRSVYEAISCLRPVIISELPWYHSKFNKDDDIFVVTVKDETKLGEMIINILKGNEKRSLETAFKFVHNNIGMVTNSKKMEKLYFEILMEK